MTAEYFLFFLIAIASLVTAFMMVTRRNPIESVIFLIANFFCIAVIYLFLRAQFIAIIQILVYAGAIMVLFLFVIMLLNIGDEKRLVEKNIFKRLTAIVLGSVVLMQIIIGIGLSGSVGLIYPSPIASEIGTVEYVSKTLFTEFLFPFELTSILLLAAIVGVIVLAKKNR